MGRWVSVGRGAESRLMGRRVWAGSKSGAAGRGRGRGLGELGLGGFFFFFCFFFFFWWWWRREGERWICFFFRPAPKVVSRARNDGPFSPTGDDFSTRPGENEG